MIKRPPKNLELELDKLVAFMAQQKQKPAKKQTNGDTDEKKKPHPAAGFRLYGDFDEGDIVKLQGLNKKAEWNDQFAKVIKYIPDKQRYHVVTTVNRNEAKTQSALLKEDNLKLIYAVKLNTVKKQCIVCMKVMEISKILDCQFCRSIFYCSVKCRKQHFTERGHLRFMCGTYKKLAEYEHAMIDKTEKLFEFKNVIREDMNIWLNKYGLLNKGIWKRLHWNKQDGFVPYGDLLRRFGLNKKSAFAFWAFGSPKDMKKQLEEHGENYIPILNDVDGKYTVQKTGKVLKNWRAYYKLKGIIMKSPVSHFMSFVLTVYYGLTKYLGLQPIVNERANEHESDNKDNDEGTARQITIHLVGVEIELDIMHLFCELLCLLPGYDFHIFMFGYGENTKLISDEVKPETVYKVPSSRNVLKMYMNKCEYSKDSVKSLLEKKYQVPDILFGLNAGFEGYPKSWEKAVKYICKKGIPSLFTEYSITTVQSAEVHLNEITNGAGKMDEQYKMNPFRSSLVSFNPVSRYSSIQNAWIFTMFTNKLKATK